MALATQCPMCETVFRITTAQAAAKSGSVRCGQCFSVFNALDALVRVEDLEFDREPVPAFDDEPDAVEGAAPEVVAVPAPVEAAPSEDVDEPEVDPVVSSPAAPEPVREWWLPAEGEAIVLSPSAPAEPPPPAPSLDEQRLRVGWPDSRDRDDGPAPERDQSQRVSRRAARPRRSRGARIALAMLSTLAFVALLAQAAYAWRDDIAARWPQTRRPLETACVALRCRVQDPMHLDAITIESTNVEATAPNSTTFVLTALLRNRDTVDVRHPSLALTLTDAQDRPILRRVFRPEDYLAPGRPQRGFAAESELFVRVAFEISDLRFLGYRLERFYP